MTKEKTILEEAIEITNGARRADYGSPWNNFCDMAQLWSPILGTMVTPEQVALCLLQLKIARLINNPAHRDSVVDIAGYAACLSDVQAERKSIVNRTVEALGK